jgi:hypothetical protein
MQASRIAAVTADFSIGDAFRLLQGVKDEPFERFLAYFRYWRGWQRGVALGDDRLSDVRRHHYFADRSSEVWMMRIFFGLVLAIGLVIAGSYPQQVCSSGSAGLAIAHAFKVGGC